MMTAMIFLPEKLEKFVSEELVLFVVIGRIKKPQMKYSIPKGGFVRVTLDY